MSRIEERQREPEQAELAPPHSEPSRKEREPPSDGAGHAAPSPDRDIVTLPAVAAAGRLLDSRARPSLRAIWRARPLWVTAGVMPYRCRRVADTVEAVGIAAGRRAVGRLAGG